MGVPFGSSVTAVPVMPSISGAEVTIRAPSSLMSSTR